MPATLIVQGGFKPFGLGYAPGVKVDYSLNDCTDITQPMANPPDDPVVCACVNIPDETAATIAADPNYTVLFSYP